MSKNDYELLATTLKKANATFSMCYDVGVALRNENYRFRMDTWMIACGHPNYETEA